MSAVHRTLAAVDRFLFAPVDARPVAVMRITWCLLMLWSWVWLGPELDTFFVADSIHDPRLVERHWKNTSYLAISMDWSAGSVHLAHLGGVGLLLLYLFGFGTDVVKFLVVGMLVATYHRAPWIWNGGDRLMRIWGILLCFTSSGAVWSVDAWIKQKLGWKPRTTVPVLVHRLIALQLVVMYTYTGIDKALVSYWQEGTAVYWAMSDAGYSRASWLYDPLLQTTVGVWLTGLLTYFTLVFELGFGPAILWKRTRPLAVAAGVALHTGIFFTLSVGMFGPASVWGYQALLPWALRRPEAADDAAEE